MATIIAIDTGPEMSQNRYQLLTLFFLKNLLKSEPTIDHSPEASVGSGG